MVMVLLSKRVMICFGHLNCHTVCLMLSRPGQITPPAPSRHASVYWIKLGYLGTRSETGVGWSARCCMTERQSSSVCLMIGVIVTNGGVPFRAAWRGDRSPCPPGTANEACCILPVISW